MQPFSIVLYGWSFATILFGTAMFVDAHGREPQAVGHANLGLGHKVDRTQFQCLEGHVGTPFGQG